MSYKQRLIGFVDILGFGQLVMDSEKDKEKFELIENVIAEIQAVDDMYGSPESLFAHSNYNFVSDEMRASLNTLYEETKKAASAHRVSITTFSDSIVFSCPADSQGLSNFRYFLIKLLVKTSKFCLLVRGGISCGSLVHTENSIFGPAMNRAYHTESKVAKYPRIAADEDFTAFIDGLQDDAVGRLLKSELILDKADGVTYLDSLCLSTNKVAQNMCGANAYEILANERRTIDLLRGAVREEDVLVKINWYASYFNRHLENAVAVEVVTTTFQGMPFESVLVSVVDLKVSDA
ncbi:hypothetical protein ACYZT4_26455 [Pseudomonas sp. GB2N2]